MSSTCKLPKSAAATIALVVAATVAAPADAQGAGAPIAQMQCQGSYGGVPVQGVVSAELYTYQGGGVRETSGYTPYLMRGDLSAIPGTVGLFGNLVDGYGSLVNFEVFLTGVSEGTGSYWINHARHRETYMRLAMMQGGFAIQTEDGVTAQFQCQVPGYPPAGGVPTPGGLPGPGAPTPPAAPGVPGAPVTPRPK